MKQLILAMIFLLITNTLEKPTISTLQSTETTEFIDYTTSDPVIESTISYDDNIGDLLNVKNISAEEIPLNQHVEETENPHTTAEINTSYDNQTEYDTGRMAVTEDTPEHDQADTNVHLQNVTNPDVTTDAAVSSVADEISFQRDEPLKEMKTSDNLYQKPNTFIMDTGREESAATFFQKHVDGVTDYGYINNNKQPITKFTKSSSNKQSSSEDESVFIHSSRPFVNRRMTSNIVPLDDYETLKGFKEIGKRIKVPCTMRSHQKNIERNHLPIYITPRLPLRLTEKQTDFKSYRNDVKSVSLKKNVSKEVSRPFRGYSISSNQLNKLDDVFLKLAKATDVSAGRLQSFNKNEYNYIGY